VLGPRERVGAAEALAMHTVHAARALRADRLGVLAPGVPADVIVVTPDPLTADETALRETSVRLTMIGGRIVWRA
jgi:predicted amidohydrolase YtcJ